MKTSSKGIRHYSEVVTDYVQIFGMVGIFYLIYAVLVQRPVLVRAKRSWSPEPLYLRLATTDVDVFRQVLLRQEYGVLRNINSPLNTILDGGANIGLTTLFLTRTYPSATIIAIEPEKSNFELLDRNCGSFPNVHCIMGALWHTDAMLAIKSEDAETCAFQVEQTDESSGTVRAYRISSLMNVFNISHVSLLKMDIEGAEIEVFSDAESWKRDVNNIIVELHDRIRPGCSDAFNVLSPEFKIIATTRELTLASRIQKTNEDGLV